MLIAVIAAVALLLLGAAAAYLSRREVKPDSIQRAEAATPAPALRTIPIANRYEVADALVRAGLPEKRSARLGQQAADALRAGDSHIMVTLDVATPRPSLVRLEATRPDGSKVVLAAQPTGR